MSDTVKCEWAVLCDYTFRDDFGKVCLIGVFDQIAVTRVPTNLPRMALAFRFSGPPSEDVSSSIQMATPGGEFWFGTVAGRIRETGNIDFNCNLSGFELPEFGAYSCRIYLAHGLAKSAEFSVVPVLGQSKLQEVPEYSVLQDQEP